MTAMELKPLALITGGHGDLAQATAQELARNGWNVLAPGRAELDVADAPSVRTYFAALTRLDLLIHNAGAIDDQPLSQMTEAAWDRVQQVNLRGAFLCTRAALPLMQSQRGGHVIFIGSRSARFGPAGQSNYAAAKAGVIGLAQSLAQEHGVDQLRFNVVLPGFLETKMTRRLPAKVRACALAHHTLAQFNTVAEAARTIVFLASLAYVSGQVFQLDSRLDPWT